jgi:hypothetical protein
MNHFKKYLIIDALAGNADPLPMGWEWVLIEPHQFQSSNNND